MRKSNNKEGAGTLSRIAACRSLCSRARIFNSSDGVDGLAYPGMAVATDITDPESVRQLAERVSETYESVDVLVNNAGVCCSGPFADTTLEDW